MVFMRFCMVTTFFPPLHFGGDAVWVANLANALADQGHDVEVVHCADAFKLLQGPVQPSPVTLRSSIRVHTLSSMAGALSPIVTQATGRSGLKRRSLESILASGFDVVHFHNLSLIGLDAIEMSRGVRVCTLHDYWWICPTHILFRYGREACESRDCLRCQVIQHRPPQLWRFGPALERAARGIHLFLAPSEFVRSRYETSPPHIQAKVLPHFTPALSVPRQPENLASASQPYFFFAGRLERAKGLQEIIPLFLRTGRDLWIAGAGTYESELRRLAGGRPEVKFLGRLTPAELRPLYAHAVASVVPSICYETFGLTVLESLQAGTPAIVSAYGALPEVAAATGNAFVYHDEAGLEAILKQVESAGFRATWATPNLKSYQPEQHLKRYFEYIDEVRQA